MNKKLDEVIQYIKDDLGLFLSISFGIFLFILFFQPFSLERFDFNNRLIFIAGLGGIIFFWMILIRIIMFFIRPANEPMVEKSLLTTYSGGLLILVMSSVSFAFYLRYVGLIEVSFYNMIKVVLICLVPPVVLRLYDVFNDLKTENEILRSQVNFINHKKDPEHQDDPDRIIEFVSENNTENFLLPMADVVFIKSADNYVEIIFKEGNTLRKKLLRNTLKNIESNLQSVRELVRCHRICIVNTFHIEKLNRDSGSHWLTIRDYNEPIPVSRQYLLRIKEYLASRRGEYNSPQN